VQDHQGKIWVLSGNKYKGKSSYLTCIDPVTDEILRTFQFSADADPIRLSLNHSADTLYFINVNYNGQSAVNGLFRMSVNAHAMPSLPFIAAPFNTYFWAYAIHPTTHHLFLSDPKGFTQSSTIYEYNMDGEILHTYQSGIGSNQFLFR
jgi:hypothetical protein